MSCDQPLKPVFVIVALPADESFLIDFRVLTSWSPYLPNRTNVRFCAGFRMLAIDGATYTVAGVRKPPRNEPAGDDRRRRRGLGYGDLADAKGVCEGPRCAVARAMRRQGGNSS